MAILSEGLFQRKQISLRYFLAITYANLMIITNTSFNCVLFADGKYLYIESSFPRKENDIAMLKSPTIIFGEDHFTACLSFWLVNFELVILRH